MKGLIYKELILNRSSLLQLLLCILSLSCFPFLMATGEDFVDLLASLASIVNCCVLFFLLGMFQSKLFEVDEYKKWCHFIASTPKRGTGQVREKYVFLLLLSGGMLGWCFLLQNILNLIYDSDLDVEKLYCMLFFFQVFMNALEIPFLFCFGSKFGELYKAFVFFLVLFGVIIYALFGDLSQFGSIDTFFDWLLQLASGDGNALGTFQKVFPPISVLLYYLSYRLSCRWYLKGANTFVK